MPAQLRRDSTLLFTSLEFRAIVQVCRRVRSILLCSKRSGARPTPDRPLRGPPAPIAAAAAIAFADMARNSLRVMADPAAARGAVPPAVADCILCRKALEDGVE